MRNVVFLVLAAGVVLASDIDQPRSYRAGRISSAAADGSNLDWVPVPGKSRRLVADIPGAGRIVHMWFTLAPSDPAYLGTTRLKLFWDGSENAAVDVPFGDFFALGRGKVRQVQSRFIHVEARSELNATLPDRNVAGFNVYFPMPYARDARVCIENTSDKPINALYYHVDYQRWAAAPSPLRFHACYRESPAEPAPGDGNPKAINSTGQGNHVVLETRGRGQFVGVVLSVDAVGPGWWEGDEMIWVDGEPQPSIRGTGTEDYFGAAWGFRREFNTAWQGLSFLEPVPERGDWRAGRYTAYRFHEQDAIPFSRSFKFSIERGHNNHRRDSRYSSVAYWYQEQARR